MRSFFHSRIDIPVITCESNDEGSKMRDESSSAKNQLESNRPIETVVAITEPPTKYSGDRETFV